MIRHLLSAALLVSLASAASAEPRWTMVRTPTLTVIGDQSASTLRRIAIEMEQFRTVVGQLFTKAERPLALPSIVFVFGERNDAKPFMPLTAGGKPAQIGGFFNRGQDMNAILMTLEGFDEASRIVYHEYTHLLVGGAVRSIPVWLNEGLAEYYSTYTQTDGGKAAEVGRPIAHHVGLLRDKYTPLADLIAVDRTSDLYNEGQRRSIFYAQSWAMVHYLFAEMKDGPQAINRYAIAIANRRAPNDAFRDAFGTTPAEFDKQLRSYVHRFAFGGRRFIFNEQVPAPVVSPPVVISPGEANAWLGDLQRRIHREDEGTKRIEAAVQADSKSAAAQLALGLLRLAQERDAEGLEALKRAAELGPDDFAMQFVRGLWLLRTSYRERSAVPPGTIQALKRATELKPDSAEAFSWLASAQMREPATLADARASIERAVDLSPGDATYRIRRADIIGLQGEYEEAKKALQEIAAVSSDPVASDAASASLDSIERREQRGKMEAAEVALAGAAAASHAGTPGSARSTDDWDRVTPDLRKLQPGEVREWGLLVRLDCSTQEVKFEVRGGNRTVVATAPRMEDVNLISYLDDKDFTIACGARKKPESIYITWTPGDTPDDTRDGTVVAVEFLPKGYIP
jgi:tetratricopeptide (TPR) repeat protein